MGSEVVVTRPPRIHAWNPFLVLDGSPISLDSSIRDFNDGRDGFMVDAVEQALLLPQDKLEL